jgi:glycosyltransferase involved in cell wall biosynthesis/SAM-dependent methyltransferase
MDHRTPTPDQDSGSIDTFNILLLLRDMGFQPTFIPEDNLQYIPSYTANLQRAGIEMLYYPYCSSVEQHLKEFGHRYDLVFLFRVRVVEKHLQAIHTYCQKAKVLFHTVDLHHVRMFREAELYNDSDKHEKAEKMKESELTAIRAVDMATLISAAEYDWLHKELPDSKIRVLPFSRSVRGTDKGFNNRHEIVFVGGYEHHPNVDAVQYFVNEIMPKLRKQLPGVHFNIVGSKVPPEVFALACDDVIIIGFVEDLNPFLDKMRVSVAPLRYGAGIKGKVGSALAVGLPVVASPLAAEGMPLTAGENILIANDAQQFADAITNLYTDEKLWNTISQNGLKVAENAWGAEAAWNNLHDILADISVTTYRNSYPLKLYSDSGHTFKSNSKFPTTLNPIASVDNRKAFELAMTSDAIKQVRWIENKLLESAHWQSFKLNGFCSPCGRRVDFFVNMKPGPHQRTDGLPNWREGLVCPSCKMKNRQRLIALLINQVYLNEVGKTLYFMEKVTPFYEWANKSLINHQLIGSEYLGHEYESGAIINGIQHEDAEHLSFIDQSIDLIVSNDVFEHVPNPQTALSECARVLKPGGILLATIPFYHYSDQSIARAEIVNGEIKHLLPPLYHINPLSTNGSLVFTDFGWDIIETIKNAGFSVASVDIYSSAELGHLGGGQIIFKAKKN